MKQLKLNDKLLKASKATLKNYLDKGYHFKVSNHLSQSVYKDTAHTYPYRFKMRGYISEDIQGCWNEVNYIVTKIPHLRLNFTKLIQCY